MALAGFDEKRLVSDAEDALEAAVKLSTELVRLIFLQKAESGLLVLAKAMAPAVAVKQFELRMVRP